MLMAVFAASGARAQANPRSAETAQLELRAPEGADCIDAGELSRQVAEHLGREVFSAQSPDVVVEVAIASGPTANSWSAVIRVATADAASSGERRVAAEGESCRVLDESLLLVVALATDSALFDPAQKPERRPTAGPRQLVRTRPAPRRVAPVINKPRSADWRLDLHTLVTGEGGALPSFAAGARIGADIGTPLGAGVSLRFGSVLPERIGVPGGGSATVSHASGGLALCPLMLGGKLRAHLCAGAEIVTVRVTPVGVQNGHPRDSASLQPVVDGRAFLSLGRRLAVVLGAGAGMPLKRDRMVVETSTGNVSVFRLNSWALFGGVGASVLFN
jgi:hypothetical protein